MQTERVTFLTTPEAKAAMNARAASRGISTGEFIRLAVDNMADHASEEEELAALVAVLVGAVPDMRMRLDRTADRIEQAVEDVDRKLRVAGLRG